MGNRIMLQFVSSLGESISIMVTNMDMAHMHIFLQHLNRWMQFISL
ncbi:Uncharacterised protein [Streptococcus pneumoniae]|nr:Uncharacterised protein [Streptococcus pneumoniae]